MITRIFQSIDELNNVEEAWTDLLSRAEISTPFQKPRYNFIWWSTLGGGEWNKGDLWVFAGYDQTDRLVGLAPLFSSQSDSDGNELRLIGSVEISDYLDLIVDPAYASDFIETLLSHILTEASTGKQRLVLDNLLEESPTISVLEQVVQARGWQLLQERIEPSPLLALPSSMDAYLENLGSKQRREFRRKMRRAANYPAQVTWRIEDQGESVIRDIEIFLDLMRNDPGKRAFLTGPMKEHFRQLAVEGCEAGWLHLAFLEVSGKPVFGYLDFVTQDRLWVYNSGFNPDHVALSPGWVLMGYLIQWAIESGFEAIDFMRGDEDYKYRLGGTDRFVCRLTIEP
jgi:CelD/BcsL family acetyltransferase involved in cellulose biosynthesis